MESFSSPKVILLVEDSPDLQEIFEMILSDAGYCVVVAGNGAEALKRLENLKPDVIVTDLMMPEVSGVELAAALKEIPPLAAIPIALVTATPSHKILQDLRLFHRVIQKPCDVDTLLELVQSLIISSRMNQEAIPQIDVRITDS